MGPWLAVCFALGSCATPPEGRLEPSEILVSLEERSNLDSWEAALDEIELPPSILRLPEAGPRANPAQPG